jgi:dTDP-4-dehydrorhamnose 3,5-epimerase-like enzyme
VKLLETKLDGPLLIEPNVHGDERGFFAETTARISWPISA